MVEQRSPAAELALLFRVAVRMSSGEVLRVPPARDPPLEQCLALTPEVFSLLACRSRGFLFCWSGHLACVYLFCWRRAPGAALCALYFSALISSYAGPLHLALPSRISTSQMRVFFFRVLTHDLLFAPRPPSRGVGLCYWSRSDNDAFSTYRAHRVHGNLLSD